MILQLGSYSFPRDTVQFVIEKRAVLGKTGRRTSHRIVWHVWGYLTAADASAITSAIAAFEAAARTDNQTIAFYDNDSNLTAHYINTGETLNGVRITGGPDYTPGLAGQWGPTTEYFNRRSFKLRIEAEIPAVEGFGVVYYREVARLLAPGFADFVVQEALSGLPQRQETAQFTKQIAQQEGMAIGFESPILPPATIWPSVHMKPRPFKSEVGTPIEWGINKNTHYQTSWLFHFEAASGLALVQPTEPAM